MKDICYTSEGTLMQNARSLCYINPRKPVLTLNITFSRINTGEEDIAISSENVQQLSHTNEPEHHGISSVIPCPPDNLDRQSFPTLPTSRRQPTKHPNRLCFKVQRISYKHSCLLYWCIEWAHLFAGVELCHRCQQTKQVFNPLRCLVCLI